MSNIGGRIDYWFRKVVCVVKTKRAWMLYMVTIKIGFAKFQHSRMSVFDGPRTSILKTAFRKGSETKVNGAMLRSSALFTPDNKRNHETSSQQCLTMFKRNSKKFLGSFATVH